MTSAIHAGLVALVAVLGTVLGAQHADLPAPRSVLTPSPSVDLGSITKIRFPGAKRIELAANGRGDAVIVGTEDRYRSGRIFAIYRRAGGTWSPPALVGFGALPQAGIDAAGNVTVVWSTHRPGRSDGVRAAQRIRGVGWTESVGLVDVVKVAGYRWPGTEPYSGCDCITQHGAGHLQLSVLPGGRVVVTWDWGERWMNDTTPHPAAQIQVATLDGDRWTRPLNVTGRVGAVPLDVAITEGHPDVATLVFHRNLVPRGVSTRDWRIGDRLTPAQHLTRGWWYSELWLGEGGRGLLVTSRQRDRVSAFYRNDARAWTSPELVVAAGASCVPSPASHVDAEGGATVVWLTEDYDPESDTTSTDVWHRDRDWAGSWSAPTVDPALADLPFGVADCSLIGNASGDRLLVSLDWNARSWITYRSAGGDWSSPLRVTGPVGYPQGEDDPRPALTAMDDQGNALVAWAIPAEGKIAFRELSAR